jgi:hypothetical protein
MEVIVSLSEELDEAYSEFLQSMEHSLFYVSLSYKRLLEKLLGCKSKYFVALDSQKNIVGTFPLMIKENQALGNIANSLPYYGSNGGILVNNHKRKEEQHKIRQKLLYKGEQYIREQNCVVWTLITSPFEQDQDWFKRYCPNDFIDQRIGQITPLPSNTNNLSEQLLKMFENPRPRNIRKAIKSGVQWYVSYIQKDLEFLYHIHQQNISAIGGLPKNKKFFSLIPEIFNESEYKVYIAEKDGEKIAGLLLFYFNKTVEYYTPVVVEEFRSIQPLSLLVFEAMKDAVNNNYRYWNWGGTWLSQKGVYNFKKKWGTKDYSYFYYTKVNNRSILQCPQEELLRQYPNFYVVPFDVLVNRTG